MFQDTRLSVFWVAPIWTKSFRRPLPRPPNHPKGGRRGADRSPASDPPADAPGADRKRVSARCAAPGAAPCCSRPADGAWAARGDGGSPGFVGASGRGATWGVAILGVPGRLVRGGPTSSGGGMQHRRGPGRRPGAMPRGVWPQILDQITDGRGAMGGLFRHLLLPCALAATARAKIQHLIEYARDESLRGRVAAHRTRRARARGASGRPMAIARAHFVGGPLAMPTPLSKLSMLTLTPSIFQHVFFHRAPSNIAIGGA